MGAASHELASRHGLSGNIDEQMDNNGQRMSNANSNPGLYVQDVYADPDSITSNDTQSVNMRPYANAEQTANNITYAAQETQAQGQTEAHTPEMQRIIREYQNSVDPVLLDLSCQRRVSSWRTCTGCQRYIGF